MKDDKQVDDFYPIFLPTTPPTILTRDEVDRYFESRNTSISVIHLPATNPRDEDGH
jgi:hypothetical protein